MGPAFDTSILPASPARALSDGRFHQVPVISGTTRDESRLFVPLFGYADHARALSAGAR
jgi:para-nitrobenzyl esterase